jgi:aspartyl-tRNA(Asn)/glutamyl-tRNA(Gln) amidotransferase subunit B
VFEKMWGTGRTAADIVQADGLSQIDDRDALNAIVEQVAGAHPAEVEQIRAGRNSVFGFLVGQVMKATGGKANPKLAAELLRQKINAG